MCIRDSRDTLRGEAARCAAEEPLASLRAALVLMSDVAERLHIAASHQGFASTST